MSLSRIESLLGSALPGLAAVRPARGSRAWRYRLGSDGSRHASVGLEGGWVVIQATEPRLVTMHPLMRIAAQREWAGGVKYAAAGRGAAARVRVDVPLLCESVASQAWLRRQLALATAGLLAATTLEAGHPSVPGDSAFDSDPAAIAALCSSAGWNATAKPEGAVWIALESRSMPRTITLAITETAPRLTVSLAVGRANSDPDVLRACGLFLLRASTAMRWARAWASVEDGQITGMGFECALAGCSDDAPLTCAIDAMASACELFGCEAEALTASPSLARAYLEHAVGTRGGADAATLQSESVATHAPKASASPEEAAVA